MLQSLAVCLAFTAQGCYAQPQIKGQVEMHPGWKSKLYLVQPRFVSEIAADYLGVVIDSADVDSKGNFSFYGVPVTLEKTLFQLVVQQNNSRFANHLSDTLPSEANYIPVVLTKGKQIVLTTDISNFQKSCVFIDPSTDNTNMMILRDIRLVAFEKYISSKQNWEDDSLLLEREAAYQSYAKSMMEFADTTSSIEAAMVAVRWVSPSGDFERNPEFIHEQCHRWKKDQPTHPFTAQLCRMADKNILPVLVGDSMPDFQLPLLSGDTLALHHLLGEQLTIVDIWASWCLPCRKENRDVLRPLWSAYRERGLHIIGYSIDNNASSWRTAVSKDEATWIQSSNLTGDATPFLEALRIATIPANFILDANGMIVAKNLYGQALLDFVHERME